MAKKLTETQKALKKIKEAYQILKEYNGPERYVLAACTRQLNQAITSLQRVTGENKIEMVTDGKGDKSKWVETEKEKARDKEEADDDDKKILASTED